jgi:hypothetical protein
MWLNINNIVFNKVTWINLKQLAPGLLPSSKLKETFQEARKCKNVQFMELRLAKNESSSLPTSDVNCPSFDWASSWNKSYGGRTIMAYLLEHPGESHNIHVVM